jgi:acyl dehydratase
VMPFDFEQLSIGMIASRSATIGPDQILTFIDLTGDGAPVHTDDAYARTMGYDGKIAHGLLVGAMFSRILGCDLPGPKSVILKLSLEMPRPVFIGETIRYDVTVGRLSEAARTAVLELSAKNASDEEVSRGAAVCLYKL